MRYMEFVSKSLELATDDLDIANDPTVQLRAWDPKTGRLYDVSDVVFERDHIGQPVVTLSIETIK